MNAERPGGYREVFRVAYPLVISMGSFTLMQFCDRIFLARYSAPAIQAALPAGILSFTLIAGFMALAGYANTFVAQYFGAGDKRMCSASTVQGVIVALLSWPLMMALAPAGRLLLRASGHAPDVQALEFVYFDILMWGSVLVPLNAAISGFFTGRGDTLTNMVATVAGNLANVVLDYMLIFGRWGAPELGIAGAAYATVASGLVSPLLLGILYFNRRHARDFQTRSTLRFDRALFLRMIRFGLPSAVHLVLDVGAFTLFVLLTGRLGAEAFAASNIAFSINNVAFMPLIGIGIAAQILVGQYQGREDSATAERVGWTALKIGCLYMTVIGSSFLLFPLGYYRLFTGNETAGLSLDALLPTGRTLLIMMAVWGWMDTVNIVLSGALKGAGDTRFVMLYSIGMTWGVWMLGEAVIFFALKGGLLMGWAWMTFFVFLMAAGFLVRYRKGRWKSIRLIERPGALPPQHTGGGEALVIAD